MILNVIEHWFFQIEWKKTTVQYRKWSPTANDPETANDPQNGPQMILDRKWSPKSTANDPQSRPQMIPKVDRKWSRKKNRNDLDSS